MNKTHVTGEAEGQQKYYWKNNGQSAPKMMQNANPEIQTQQTPSKRNLENHTKTKLNPFSAKQ